MSQETNETTMNAPADKPMEVIHPWANDEGVISAKVAGPSVMKNLLLMGLSAKAACACAYTVCADLEERGDY